MTKLQAGDEPFALPAEGKVYIFDIETDGLLDDCTKLHCLVVRDFHTGELVASGTPETAPAALAHLGQAEVLIAHNGIGFDIPALKRLLGWEPKPKQTIVDTLVLARLIFADVEDTDQLLIKDGRLPGKLYKRHSLEAWGYRLGVLKGDFGKATHDGGRQDWSEWSQEMQTYCERDTLVTLELARKCLGTPWSRRSVELEHEVARICAQMERNGFAFDVQGGIKLYAELSALRGHIERDLKERFGLWWEATSEEPVSPKRGMRRWVAHEEGAERRKEARGWYEERSPEWPFTPVKLVEFNPSSRQHVSKRLIQKYGWRPEEFTPAGQPKVDEAVLKRLPYPEAQALARYYLVLKRCGQVGDGDQAWLKVEKQGRIHGSVNTNGAITGRMSHHSPNIAQVPSVKVGPEGPLKGEAGEYGYECRSLFIAPPGRVLVGADLSGLELRCLAHYLAKYDGGRYAEVLVSSDPHMYLKELSGVATRAIAKTLGYALLFSAGDMKLGSIIDPKASEAQKRSLGRDVRARIYRNFTGMAQLQSALKAGAQRGFLFGLDGRRLPIRKEHAALNTLLQSAGALIAKRWLVETEQILPSRGWSLHAVVHDEQVLSAEPEIAEEVAKLTTEAAKASGEYFKLRIPIAAEARIGKTWKDVH